MTRSLRHRMVAVAAMSVVALGVLAGCRTDAGTAAHVGDTRITDEQVDEIVKGVPTKSADLSAPRTEVVTELVYTAALKKYADQNKIDLPPVDDSLRDQIAQSVGVQNDATHRPFLDLEANRFTWTNELLSKQPSTTPSDADLQRLFTELKADFPKGTTFDQAKPVLLQIPNVAQGIALRNQLEPALDKYDISISPRYANNCTKAPCAAPFVPLVSFQASDGTSIPVVNLSLTKANASPAVLDLPAAVQSAATSQ